MSATTTLDQSTESTLGSVLRPIHSHWIARTRRRLEPVFSPTADFWDRWTAARYLANQFDAEYRHELAVVTGLVRSLPADVGARLTTLTETLDTARAQFEVVARRRGLARAASVVGREFLDLFQLWCVELEGALGGVRQGELPEHSAGSFRALEAAAALEL